MIPSRRWSLFALFSGELLVLSWLRLPDSLSFDRFAFCDNGANLTAQYLVAHAYRPTIDFGYHYGLLPLLLGRVWFAIFGLNPFAYQALMVALSVAMAYAWARIATSLKLGALGLALMFIALGFAVQPTYPSLAQALEAALLIFALAEQSAGRLRSAMALAASAIFAKPSMGLVYLPLLALLAAVKCHRSKVGLRGLLRDIIPSAGVFFVLAIVLGSAFGADALASTFIPIGAAQAYRTMNFGFFTGAGRDFWQASGLPWTFYLVDVSGFWIASSLYLIVSGLVAARRYLAESEISLTLESRRDEIIMTCAVLHVAFMFLFFGNQFSWFYYFYFLIVGIAAAADGIALRRRVAMALCVLALLSWIDVAFWVHRWWITTRADPVAGGLWISSDERDEWRKVLDSVHGKSAVMLDSDGAVQLMFPGFEPPVSAYLESGWMLPTEITRKLNQIYRAGIVVVPIGITLCKPMPHTPEFDSAMKKFALVWAGKYFAVYQPAPRN